MLEAGSGLDLPLLVIFKIAVGSPQLSASLDLSLISRLLLSVYPCDSPEKEVSALLWANPQSSELSLSVGLWCHRLSPD